MTSSYAPSAAMSNAVNIFLPTADYNSMTSGIPGVVYVDQQTPGQPQKRWDPVGQAFVQVGAVTYNPRTTAQLAAAPQAADIALGDGALFYATTAPEVLYRMNAGRTAFVGVGAVSGAGISGRRLYAGSGNLKPIPRIVMASPPTVSMVGTQTISGGVLVPFTPLTDNRFMTPHRWSLGTHQFDLLHAGAHESRHRHQKPVLDHV